MSEGVKMNRVSAGQAPVVKMIEGRALVVVDVGVEIEGLTFDEEGLYIIMPLERWTRIAKIAMRNEQTALASKERRN